MAQGQLSRSRSNRILGGVAGGIAAYTGLDSGLVRLITAAVVLFTGIGAVIYILAWILLPEEGGSSAALDSIIGAFKKGRDQNSNPNPDDLR